MPGVGRLISNAAVELATHTLPRYTVSVIKIPWPRAVCRHCAVSFANPSQTVVIKRAADVTY